MKFNFHLLFDALQRVLQEDFEEELLSAINECEYGRSTKGILEHRFQEWIIHRIWQDQSLHELQRLLGRRNTKKLLIELGENLPDEAILSSELQKRFDSAFGLSNLKVKGRKYYSVKAKYFLENEPIKIATEVRTVCERMLREILLVALNTKHSESIIKILKEDFDIRIPKKWGSRETFDRFNISEKINDDTTGDLGLLTIILSKASKITESDWQKAYTGEITFTLLHKEERHSLHKLAKALLPFAHFKPSKENIRDAELRDALEDFAKIVKKFEERFILPEAAIFLEHRTGFLGSFYHGIKEDGNEIVIRSDDNIPLMERILFWEISNPVHIIAGWAKPNW